MEENNLEAEKQYIKCKMQRDKSYDVKNHLLSMLEKYKNFPKYRLQSILLEIAFLCWSANDDIYQVLNYFLKAIEIDSTAICLKVIIRKFS